jgi:hypothetical protein
MTEDSYQNSQESLEKLQIMQMILVIREKAFRQIIFGLLWWVGSSIAVAVAMSMTGDAIYWFGGALGSLFHWYKAAKMINATRKVGAKVLIRKEAILIGVTALLVFVSVGKIVPEYLRITTPTVGTCWGTTQGQLMAPVACWSSAATNKTVAFASSSDFCPSVSTGFFDPSSRETRFTCLTDI